MQEPMNRFCLVLLFIIGIHFGANAQQKRFAPPTHYFYGHTRFDVGFYHIGSYSKERPILYLEQSFNYWLNQRFSFGAGFGINLYPAALAFPVFVNGNYHFTVGRHFLTWSNTLGANLRLGELSFSSFRYLGTVSAPVYSRKSVKIVPEVGYSLLLDRSGGGAITFLAGIGIQYRFGKQ